MILKTELRDDTLFYTWEEHDEPNYGDYASFAEIEGVNPSEPYTYAMKAHEQSCILARQNAVVAEDSEELELILLSKGIGTKENPIEKNKPYVLTGYSLKIDTDHCIYPCCDQCQEFGCMGKQVVIITTDKQ